MGMSALINRHFSDSQPARFEVVEAGSGRHAHAVEVPSPYEFPVKDRPSDSLMSQLRWYLDDFLQYPFTPRTEQAANVEDALSALAEQAFSALFSSGHARDWFIEPRRIHGGRQTPLHLQISSDDPAILSWPWEALKDPDTGALAYQARIERRLNFNLPDPPQLSKKLPRDGIHILLVTARPY
jgi:hypothetical protein